MIASRDCGILGTSIGSHPIAKRVILALKLAGVTLFIRKLRRCHVGISCKAAESKEERVGVWAYRRVGESDHLSPLTPYARPFALIIPLFDGYLIASEVVFCDVLGQSSCRRGDRDRDDARVTSDDAQSIRTSNSTHMLSSCSGGTLELWNLLTVSSGRTFNNLPERPYRLVNACKERASA